MAHGTKTHIRTLQKRGSGLCVVVPSDLLELLGWNRDDSLRLDILDRSLVVTRIELPKIPDLRSPSLEVSSDR